MKKNVHAFSDDALGFDDAVGLAAAISAKKISPLEVTQAAIARAEKVNTDLNAIVCNNYEQALKNAKQPIAGFFGGLPTFIKDNENLKGLPTQFGTKAFVAKTATRNSQYVNQMLSTGLNAIGKTTLPEFGLICSTENPKWGITRNPWNTEYTTGGSSSGSAAMVAAGVVPIAMANDGAGSTRIPASCCGLVGLKPTRNRLVNFEGSGILPINIGYEGVVTRSVRDTIAFYTAAEQHFQNKKLPQIGNNIQPISKRLKVVFFDNLPQEKMGHQDKNTHDTILQTAALLESLGHQVEVRPFPLDVDFLSQHFLNYYGLLAFLMKDLGRFVYKSKLNKDELESFTKGLSKQFTSNISKLPASLKLLKKTGAEVEALFKDFDVVLTPVVSTSVPKIGYFDPTLTYEEISKRAIGFASFTGLQNITGAPAISLPLGTSQDGLPIGVHFTAASGQDKLLLELSLELEAAKPFKRIWE
jgi:amidase